MSRWGVMLRFIKDLFQKWIKWAIQRNLIPEGAGKRDFVLPVLIATITGMVTITSIHTFRSQETHAVLIDVAGRQRMLTQRLSREVHSTSNESLLQPLYTLQNLRDLARVLRDGGNIELRNGTESNFTAPPAWNNRIRNNLDKQIELIDELSQLIATSAASSARLIHPIAFDLIDRILANADESVQLYVEALQQSVREILIRSLVLTLGLAMFGLWLNKLIVERKYRMQQLSVARDAAIHASEAKSVFLANMSHEIRTPLNAIIGMTDVLQNTDLNREQRRFIATLNRAGDTLLSLINDILDLSKIESGQVELDRTDMDLFDLIERMGEIMAFRAHQKGLELICDVSSKIPRHINADSTRLRQILMNLLGNAVKFTSAGEIVLRVEIQSVEGSSALLRFAVSDTGIGIPESKFATIFDSFSQVDPTISVNYGGTGLGLAICKRLVELMGGRIWVRSQLGVGSTFYFTLPVQLLETQPSPEAEAERIGSALKDRRILVIDDNDTNRLIVRKYLRSFSAQIDEAHNGSDAIEMMREARAIQRPFDLVLLDYRMPGMNGFDVAEAVRKENLAEGAIIMLLTSDGKRSDIGRLGPLGISEYMVKPLHRNELLRSIEHALTQGGIPSQRPQEPTVVTFPSGKGRNVLVVDDVEDNRLIVSSYLEGEGYHIDEASSGPEAIDRFKHKNYDLVLMDIRMSPMDGYTTTRALRDLEKQAGSSPASRTPIIALTAHAMKEEIDRALSSGCDLHVTKPITKARLADALRAILQEKTSVPFDDEIPIVIEPFLKPRVVGYLENRRKDLAQLRAEIPGEDLEDVIRIAHNISGTAGVYGMPDLSQMAHDLEVAAKASDRSTSMQLIDRMESYLSRVRPT